jgi:hypothetical protein
MALHSVLRPKSEVKQQHVDTIVLILDRSLGANTPAGET